MRITEDNSGMIKNYGILLFPEFSNLCFANLKEPLRAANDLSDQPVARYHLFSLSGNTVSSSSSLVFSVDKCITDIGDMAQLDILFVLASYNYESYITPESIRQLKALRRHTTQIAGLDAAPFALAKAGLLDGYRATISLGRSRSFSGNIP